MLNKAKNTKVKTYYRDLHQIPETGFDLERTKQYVKNVLTEMGLTVLECGKCGLVTEIGQGTETFLLRADMDALPFGGENIHACGHDMHTAMLLGATELLKQCEPELRVKVRFMFQSAEELLEGSKDMIENGVLDGVCAAMMLHVTPNVPFKTGTAVVPAAGVSAPSADFFTATVMGKGCHGSSPWNGKDPIISAVHILSTLQNLALKEMSPDTMLTVGMFNAGTSPNVIPDTAVMRGSCRCFDENERQKLKTRMKFVCENIAVAFETRAKLTFDSGCPTLVNDSKLRDKIKNCVTTLLGEELVIDASEMPKSSGSEDFAYVSHKIPSVMLALAAGHPDNGYCYPLHHPKVKFDIDALPYGVAIFAYAALHYFD